MREVRLLVDLTVLILTKNEESNLEKCIRSFRGIAKRYVIVDSYSTDGTEALCRRLDDELRGQGARLDFYQNAWTNYVGQFNWGLAHTEIDTAWTMRMDADEELTEELASEIERRLPRLREPVNGVIVRRRLVFMGRWIRHGGRYPEMLLRIFRTGTAVCEPQRQTDEHNVLLEGRSVTFRHDLIDRNQKDLAWWTEKHNRYSDLESLDHRKSDKKELVRRLNAQARWRRMLKNGVYYQFPKFFRAHLYYLYRYYLRLGFLDGQEGRIFHFLQAYWYRFLVDAKLYEAERMEQDGPIERE